MEKKSPKFAVVLAGCGNFDGSELHETITGLLSIDQLGGEYHCFAPDIEQGKTVNAYKKSIIAVKGEINNRNVLTESARIARGNIKPLTELKVSDYDAIIFPGGQGAINNWCDYALKGINCSVNSGVVRVLKQAHEQQKWIGAMCIAPVIVAIVLGANSVHVTIGDDSKVAAEIASTGAIHENRGATEVCIDTQNKVVTTPCYMLATSIKEIYQGNYALIKAIFDNLT